MGLRSSAWPARCLGFARIPSLWRGVHQIRILPDCGVSATVAPVPGVSPYEASNITVSLGGTRILFSFVQLDRFYTDQNVAVLFPKSDMTFVENSTSASISDTTGSRIQHSAAKRTERCVPCQYLPSRSSRNGLMISTYRNWKGDTLILMMNLKDHRWAYRRGSLSAYRSYSIFARAAG
jgi:hypothetical protein